jgi:hypothetical protein
MAEKFAAARAMVRRPPFDDNKRQAALGRKLLTENCFDTVLSRAVASGIDAACLKAIPRRRRSNHAHDDAGSVSP